MPAEIHHYSATLPHIPSTTAPQDKDLSAAAVAPNVKESPITITV